MISALVSFLGGSVFRMLWGEISAWLTKAQDHKHEIERGRVWFDEHLFHDGAMDPRMIDGYLQRWEMLGFQIAHEVNGNSQWADMCCIEYQEHQMPDWLELAPNGHSAFRAGTEPGDIVTPDWLKKIAAV